MSEVPLYSLDSGPDSWWGRRAEAAERGCEDPRPHAWSMCTPLHRSSPPSYLPIGAELEGAHKALSDWDLRCRSKREQLAGV